MNKTLIKRMIDEDITRDDLASLLQINPRTLYNRIYGVQDWKFSEMVTIRDAFFPDDQIEVLFERFPFKKRSGKNSTRII